MNSPLKFLVVDALAGVQTFARQLLQSRGFAAENIRCCADTETALAEGLVFKPNFLVTDWFPRSALTGPDLYQRLRESLPTLHLSLLSFDVTPDHQLKAKALGAHFLLKKPFTAEQLQAEITRSLDALARSSPELHGQVHDVIHKTRMLPRPAVPIIPPQPVVKPGDRVRYQGAVHVAQHVVHRHSETVVQLKGMPGFVPVDKLQLA